MAIIDVSLSPKKYSLHLVNRGQTRSDKVIYGQIGSNEVEITYHFLVPVVICLHFNDILSERRSYAFWLPPAPDRGALSIQNCLSNWQHSDQLASDCSV